MVKSLVSKLSSASSSLSIASSFGGNHGKQHPDNTSTSSTSTAISGDNYLKYRNDPGRFFGDGVQFKAKLIGILEVGEARGDRMCQEALQDLKMAIRAAGEHKQRISIHVTIDGLRLRDEKTGDSLYHHPVHKISFIAQDMTDSRAFGYIFGSPDSGHRFFGIKTDKAASQVVLAMRDLFQVVFELKKKEIELARQQIQSKSLHHHDQQHQLSSLSSLKSAAAGVGGPNDPSGLGGSTTSAATLSMLNTMVSSSTNTPNISRLGVNLDSKGASKEISPESVADLVDLEQELSSLQRGITQMERITPNDTHSQQTSSLSSNVAKTSNTLGGGSGGGGGSDDPFGDSFTSFPTLPPPEPGRLRSKTTAKPSDINITNIPTSSAGNSALISPTATQSRLTPASAGLSVTTESLQPIDDDDDHWLRELDAHSDVFDTSKTVVPGLIGMPSLANSFSSSVPLPAHAPLATRELSDTPPNHIYETVSCSATNMPTDTTELSSIANNEINTADANTNNLVNSTSLSDIFQTGPELTSQNSKMDIKSEPVAANADPVMLPRDTDPFSPTRKKSDPFEEGGDLFSKLDPFEFEFNSGIMSEVDKVRKAPSSFPPSADQLSDSGAPASQDLLAGHLQVNLPPEGDLSQPMSTVRSRPVPSSMSAIASGPGITLSSSSALPPASMLKQQTVDVISSISNKKMPHLFGQSSRFSKRDSNSINMRRLQESDSLSETETAPEPPPRPDYSICAEPPPLPPKKQFNEFVIKSRAGLSHSLSSTTNPTISSNRYDSLNSTMASKSLIGRSANTDVPPIPLPSRRVGRTDGSYPGPGRPRKPGHTEDDYLAPISLYGSSTTGINSIMSDVPPLLPPPTQVSSRSRTQRQPSLIQQSKVHDIYENKSEILQQIQQQQLQQQQQQQLTQQQQQNILEHSVPAPTSIVPDITLTQLLTLGIDELAVKLNVPITKLSTMTLVELTSYLSEFLEKSKPSKVESKIETPQQIAEQNITPIFKVNFDQEATFVAKFDDTFGEDFHQSTSSGATTTFEANFAKFDSVNVEPPEHTINNMVPPADRYAVFREIIDQELQQQQESVDLIGDVMETEISGATEENQFDSNIITDLNMNVNNRKDLLSGDMVEMSAAQPPTIDTKITEVLAQAKDRYAALRDLILVENLFDKPPPKTPSIITDAEADSQADSKSPFQGFSGFNDDEDDQDLRQLMDQATSLDVVTQQQRLGLVDSRGFLVEPSSSAITVEEDEDDEEEECRNNGREDTGALSSADSNEKEQGKDIVPTTKYEQLASSNQQLEEIEQKTEKFDENPQICITQSQMPSNNDSKYLSVVSVASSGLSGSKDDLEIDDLMQRAISNLSLDSRERNSPASAAAVPQQKSSHTAITTITPPHFNDVSTSPMPMQRSPGPSLTNQQNKSPNNKSPQQISPLASQLTVVSEIIDAATKQIQSDAVLKTSNETWATFDTPQHQPVTSDKRARPSAKVVTKANNFLNLPPPPGSLSNCSQNDSAIESPCSSDPREEAWQKHTMGGSSLSLGHQTAPLGSSTSGQRRYHKKERQNTSSSSRDLSWDEDQGSVAPSHALEYSNKRLAGQLSGSLTTDRHGYYRRHARRMNSCDDEYEYEQDYPTSRRDRDQCKYKHSLSRSRDNFEMDTPGWYHHHGGPQHPHHIWSSQEIEQARGRTFDRSAYERTTYGPPIYDKRGVGPPIPPPSSYDRRPTGGNVYDKRGKYYRGDSNPRSTERIYNLDDFDEMLAASGKIPAHLAAMYEEMKAECCSPTMPTHRHCTSDYMYERDRKSFDRESLESYEGSNVVAQRRRRRSYDSGGMPSDPYGSCDSRDEYHGRDRCVMTADKSRSLRKSLKSLRVTGDIDYDPDSEKEYHYRDQRSRSDTRSLQRPSQLSAQGISGAGIGTGSAIIGSQSRMRKSSGSSPWDGEEPPLPGQKSTSSSWKRPSSAAEAERRRTAIKGQTPSGSDEDKDRRYRKKRNIRNKELGNNVGRYGRGGNYDYISCEDLDDDAEDYVDEEEEEEEDHGIEHREISPADEDKFARLEIRRHEMHNRMMDAHVRRRKEVPSSENLMSSMAYRKTSKAGYIRRPMHPPTEPKHPQDYGFDDDADDGEYEQTPTPRSNTSSALPTATPNTTTKFSFDVGFESDFNQSSPPPASAGITSSCNSTPAANVSTSNTPASKSSFRFSSDFSGGQEREKHFQHPPVGSSLQQYDLENRGISPQTSTQVNTPKLRFDENVKVSQFDDAFEDDFSKATFDAFQNDDGQWQVPLQKTAKQQMRNNKLQQRQQELIKKSESVNIFAKKAEDPFEDDEFFNSPPTTTKLTANVTAVDDKIENHKINSKNRGNGSDDDGTADVKSGNANGNNVGWDDNNTNFAKFDENM